MTFRKSAVFLHDLLASALAWGIAFLFRFNFSIPDSKIETLIWSMAIAVPLQGLVFWRYGLYRGVWRFTGLLDLKRIVTAVGAAVLASAMGLFLYRRLDQVPRSVFILDPIFLVFLMGGSRFLYRSWKDGHLLRFKQMRSTPVFVLGAGHAASLLLRDISREGRWRAVGLLDDDPAKKGRMISGVPVLGPLSHLARLAKDREVTQVILSIPSASPDRKRKMVEAATALGLTVLTVPSLEDIMSGRVAVSRVRRVELEDLLGRGRVDFDDPELRSFLSGRVVLVSGAGGSIGSELCRQIAQFSPAKLLMLEAGEFPLFQIEQEFSERFPAVQVVPLAGDVRDVERMDQIFGQYAPQVVFHAAAYKHVPLMENGNCWEAVRNNGLGTLRLAQVSARHRVDKFVLISSDKAVNPTNVMGATKRLAEIVCQGVQGGSATRFVIVRFGNVLGSTGSVIPKFREQIARGGPVTVTHPDMTRFFMLIPEAVQLVLQAGLMGKGGEIFVLDMGSSVKIVDMARDMIRLSGFTHDEIKIVFTGIRPGEKLFEEFLANEENTLPTTHSKLRIARAREVSGGRFQEIARWLESGVKSDEEVKKELHRWIPEYAPSPSIQKSEPAQSIAFQETKLTK